MKRLFALLLLLAPLAATAVERPVKLARDFGALYGTLRTPDDGASTVVLLVAGSGPTDRNGNNPLGVGGNSYLLLAEALEEAGIASLRYDKRAIGTSRLDDPSTLADLSFDMYVDDAAALADYLAGEGFRRVVVAGHSEGALIALCAAQRTEAIAAVVSLAGAAYTVDEVLRVQLARQLAPARMDLMVEAEQILARLKRGERVDMTHCAPELQGLFNASVQRFLITQMRHDPQREIRAAACPVLVVGGDNDLQVPADHAEALAAAQPRARKVVVAGMTHTLKHSDDRTLAGQLRTVYADASLPLAEGLVEPIVAFIGGL